MFRIDQGTSSEDKLNAEKSIAAWETALAQIKEGRSTRLSATMEDETTLQIGELSIKCGLPQSAKKLARTLLWKGDQGFPGLDNMARNFHAHALLAKAALLESKVDKATGYVQMLIEKSNRTIYSDIDLVLVNGLIEKGALQSAIAYVEHYLERYVELSRFESSQCRCNIAPKSVPSRISALKNWLDQAKRAASTKATFTQPIRLR
jgi:hypothetical protein